MKTTRMFLIAGLTLLAGTGLAAEKIRVLTTTSDLKSLVDAVGGDCVTVTSLASGKEDPHFVQAKPSYMMAARKADLWVRVGLELEIGYEELILDGSRNPKIRIGAQGHLDVSEGIIRLEVPSTQKVDRSMGDVHPLGNPHYWLDPWNGRVMARNIRDRLKALDSARAETYEANYSAFLRKLDAAMFGPALVDKLGDEELWRLELAGRLDQALKEKGLAGELGGWTGKLGPHRGSKIVVYHRSWSYFVSRFGLVVAAELESKPGIPPSPGHLAEVIETANGGGARFILVEPFYEKKGAQFGSDKAGIPVVEAANSVGGTAEAPDYVAVLDQLVAKVATALSGKGN